MLSVASRHWDHREYKEYIFSLLGQGWHRHCGDRCAIPGWTALVQESGAQCPARELLLDLIVDVFFHWYEPTGIAIHTAIGNACHSLSGVAERLQHRYSH